MFYAINIIIYGGSTVRRHLISPVQVILVKFLCLINNMSLDKSLIQYSFTEEKSSNTKINRLIDNIKNNETIISNILNNQIINDNTNLSYLLRLNATIKIYFDIIYLMKESNNLNYDIEVLNNKILSDTEQLKKYINNYNLQNKIINFKTNNNNNNNNNVNNINNNNNNNNNNNSD